VDAADQFFLVIVVPIFVLTGVGTLLALVWPAPGDHSTARTRSSSSRRYSAGGSKTASPSAVGSLPTG